MVSVLRLKEGDRIEVFDGKSMEYECRINRLCKDKADLAILSTKTAHSFKGAHITLACALAKKAKIDFIIEKATELGVDTVIPLHTQRTIVEVSGLKLGNRLKRWQNIALEASKQCGRIHLPKIEPVSEFKDVVLKAKEYELALIPHLGIKNKSLKDIVSKSNAASVIVFIGPEGDFSEEEIRLAKKNGCREVSLGELTLKVDTAAIAAVAFLRLFYY